MMQRWPPSGGDAKKQRPGRRKSPGPIWRTFPSDYCLFDEHETVLLPLMAQVRAASSVEEIFKLLGPDTFEAY